MDLQTKTGFKYVSGLGKSKKTQFLIIQKYDPIGQLVRYHIHLNITPINPKTQQNVSIRLRVNRS